MTRRNMKLGVALFAFGTTWVSGAAAQPTPGGWYTLDPFAGAVLEFTAGGDLSEAQPFAAGTMLLGATSMCYGGPHNDLYVATPYFGAVHIVTAGGSFETAMPFAYQLPGWQGNGSGAFALDCTAGRVLTSVLATGAIYDVTAGGNMTEAVPFAWGFPGGVVDIFTDSNGTLWVSSQGVGIYDATAGGDFSAVAPTFEYDLGGPAAQSQIAEFGGNLYFVNVLDATFTSSEIYDFTALEPGAALSTATLFAWGVPVGIGLAASSDKMYLLNAYGGWEQGVGEIWDVTAGGDLSAAAPYAYGYSVGYQWGEDLVYIPYCGDLLVWPNSNEECDEGAETATCNANCTLASCGDGVLNATNSEVCDDGDANSDTAADACRTDCTLPTCGDGAIDTGEECDDGDENGDDPDACRADCVEPFCGDGIQDSGEGCDEGDDNSDTDGSCRTDCVPSTCGDGVVDDGEECDNGIYNNDLLRNACRTTCREARCGDGVLDTGEECDDGNDVGSDGCTNSCTWDFAGDEGGYGMGGFGAGNEGTGATTPKPKDDADDDGCALRAPRHADGPGQGGIAAVMVGLAGLLAARRRRRG